MYRQILYPKVIRFVHSLHLAVRVLHRPEIKRRLLSYTAFKLLDTLIDTECVYCAVRTGFSNTIQVNRSL